MYRYHLIGVIAIVTICSISFAQYIGDLDTVGGTWCDYQHQGTAGRTIVADSLGEISVVWMGPSSVGSLIMHIYLNYYQRDSGWFFGNVGGQVGNFYYAGSPCLCPSDLAFPVIAFDGQQAAEDTLRSWLIAPMVMYPTYWRLPLIDGEGTCNPKVALDSHSFYQFISYAHCPGGGPLDSKLFYCRSEYDTISHSWVFTPQELIDYVTTMAGDITASRHSDRVAIAYCAPRTTIYGDTNQYNNDVNLVISEDGVTWDFGHPFNVTDFIYPDTSLFPDTLAAMGDTLRAYTDVSILFDWDDNIHVAFTTIYYDEIRDTASVNNSMIWHWSDITDYYGLIARGWYEPVPFECGMWQRFVQRPCLAVDEIVAELYVTYQKYDTADIAANGYPQGEAMVSWSDNDGIFWSVSTNVTNTHAPGASSGNCLSERDITCNQTVINDTLHLFYIIDGDAGSVVWSEGSWSWNQAICQRVPIAEIARSPMIPGYPLHIDSTGFPPEIPFIGFSRLDGIPENFQLYQNYPNPFNSSTTIQFDLNRPDIITLKVFNILGREVGTLVDGHLQAGSYKVNFDAPNLASGVYFYRLSTPSCTLTRKMVLMK